MLRRHFFILFSIGFCLAGCADSETRSIVSSSDLSGNKYRRVAVFIENPDPAHPVRSGLTLQNGTIALIINTSGSATDAEIERKLLSALDSAGVRVSSGPALFSGQTLSDQSKARIIQKGFDAVLYVAILTNGMREEQVAGASHNGQYIKFMGLAPEPIDNYTLNSFELKADGTVWHNVPTFQAKCDLQDTRTNKVVWSSETIASGGTSVLLSKASSQIVEQMRTDGVI